jgi:hypothetical protein
MLTGKRIPLRKHSRGYHNGSGIRMRRVHGGWRLDINVSFVEKSNIDESERNIELGVELDVESSDSESDEAESSASESNSD